MADSAGILSSKNSEKSKLTNSVSRTTSETLRLADPDKTVSQPNSLSTSTPKKKTSFQITSVIVGCKSSNDGGDDSADDLDESHTEDISEVVDNSRVTDIENETPSYSEDTFSKDDVFFNASSSLVSAPVIPTSSQYGLAILASTENSESASNQIDNCENSGTSVAVTESVINLGVVSTKHDPEMRDMHPPAPRTERFKVVKIESTEPFKRGRWVCMDYLDHNIAQNQASSGKTDSDSSHPNTIVSDSKVGQESSSVSVNSVSSVATTEEVVQTTVSVPAPTTVVTTATAATVTEQVSNNNNPNTVNIQPADSNQTIVNNMPISAPSTMPSSYASVSPGQSLQNNMQMTTNTVVNSGQPQGTQQAQSLSQVHMQQILANSNQHQSLQSQQMQQVLANANVMPMQQQPQQSQQPQQTQQQQQQPQPQQAPPPQQQPAQTQQAQMQSQQTIQQQPIMQQPMQQMPSMHQPQQQYQPQQQQPLAQQQQFQPMQQQQSMMPQQIPTQQPLQPQLQPVQQVHMQQSIPQGMQQMPMQQQQGQQVQQQQMMQQQMQQMPQQPVHQVSYSQPLTQTQPTIVSQPSAQPQIPPGMLTHQMHAQMQNFQQNQMLTTMQPQPIMTIQSQPHLQPQYYPASMPQTSTLPGGMMPPMSQGSSLPVSMQGSSVTLPPLQTYTSIQQVPSMPQTPPVQTSVQYSLPCSIAGQQPPSVQPITQQPLPNLMQQQTPQSYASIGSPAQSYGSSVMSSLPTSVTEPVSGLISSVGSSADHPPILSTVPADYMPAPTAALLESLAEVTATPDEQQPTAEDPESLRGLARALASAALELQPPAVPHSASGASAVAIDNKIEQAMDLVKSHLMYAVREEVEVLKEKIAELMERITQLESENNILRAGASPETLAQLPPPQPQQTNNPS